MPIEIKELHIRIAVNAPQNGQPSREQPAGNGRRSTPAGEDATEMIVAECVEQVLQILQYKMER
jgi:hypothetical protein